MLCPYIMIYTLLSVFSFTNCLLDKQSIRFNTLAAIGCLAIVNGLYIYIIYIIPRVHCRKGIILLFGHLEKW